MRGEHMYICFGEQDIKIITKSPEGYSSKVETRSNKLFSTYNMVTNGKNGGNKSIIVKVPIQQLTDALYKKTGYKLDCSFKNFNNDVVMMLRIKNKNESQTISMQISVNIVKDMPEMEEIFESIPYAEIKFNEMKLLQHWVNEIQKFLSEVDIQYHDGELVFSARNLVLSVDSTYSVELKRSSDLDEPISIQVNKKMLKQVTRIANLPLAECFISIYDGDCLLVRAQLKSSNSNNTTEITYRLPNCL